MPDHAVDGVRGGGDNSFTGSDPGQALLNEHFAAQSGDTLNHGGHRDAGAAGVALNGVAIAAAATVAMTVIASLTLLPALLGFTGLRLAWPSIARKSA